jgi:hypothetical protein
VGQQPNIELAVEDLPRPTHDTAPARRWSPGRPGEIGGPGEMPGGGAFGTPGPDTGFALRILAGRTLDLGERERRHDADTALAALMAARASRAGRGPTVEDAEVAELLLGYHPDALPGDSADHVAAARPWLLAGLGHAPARVRGIVAAVDPEVLDLQPDGVRDRLASGYCPFS